MASQLLAGLVEWWANERLCELGRRRYTGRRGGAAAGVELGPEEIDVVRAAFLAQREPWRLTEIFLETSGDDPAAVVAWADDATAVLAGLPPMQRVVAANERWGDLGLRQVVTPVALETLAPKPWDAEFELRGEVVERDLSVVPELVTLAADRYVVRYDADLDVVTSWSAMIDGRVAQSLSLLSLIPLDGR